MFLYVLTALRGVSPLVVLLGGVLFYIGIAGLLVGIILRWLDNKGRHL